jgi:hypothetical protein
VNASAKTTGFSAAAVRQQQVWGNDRQTVEGVTHHSSDTFRAIERANGGQHMGRFAALATPRPAEAQLRRRSHRDATIAVRTHHEYCWAVLVSTRDDAHLVPMRTNLDNLMWTIIGHITDWPSFDLF